MKTVRLKISDLYQFEGAPPENPDFATITMFVLKRFGFLPKAKQPASVFYFLDAFKRFAVVPPEQVRDSPSRSRWSAGTDSTKRIYPVFGSRRS